MSDAPAIISIQDLRYVYPGSHVAALDGVSLEIRPGSLVGLVGRNGSGKTTLTKHLNGLLRPTSGRVVVEGLDTSREPVRRLARHVGYVFQNPGHQLFARTVADELAFGPRNLGCTRDEVEERVASVAASLDLVDVLSVHPYRLPFPIRKLVTIAGVLTMRPSVVVLDEPTTGQDQHASRRVRAVLDGLRAAGTTVVCVTHDMSLLAEVERPPGRPARGPSGRRRPAARCPVRPGRAGRNGTQAAADRRAVTCAAGSRRAAGRTDGR